MSVKPASGVRQTKKNPFEKNKYKKVRQEKKKKRNSMTKKKQFDSSKIKVLGTNIEIGFFPANPCFQFQRPHAQ
jgi:hypothetical protein